MNSMQNVSCLVVVLLLSLSEVNFAQNEPDETGSFEFDGRLRYYDVYLPENFQPNLPVIFNLPAFRQSKEQASEYTRMDKDADSTNYIIVYPSSVGDGWNAGYKGSPDFEVDSTINDVGFICALIDTLKAHYDIDLGRVYCCGWSNGAFMSYRLAIESGHRFAAAAAIGGKINDVIGNRDYLVRPFPIAHFHGTLDIPVFYDEGDGNMWSVKETIDFWVENNNCIQVPDTVALPDLDPDDGCTVEKISYETCDDETQVVLYKILDGGHTWPGGTEGLFGGAYYGNTNQDISANIELFKFFNVHENPLVNLAFARSREIQSKFLNPDGDSLIVSTHLSNPDNHLASVTAFIEGKSSAFQDSLQLFDDGLHQDGEPSDNIFGGVKWMATNAEDMFGVTFQTSDDQLEMTTHIPYPLYFTTIGPVVADSVSLPFLSNNRIGFDVYLGNAGHTVTAAGISATIYPDTTHPCFVSVGLSKQYGDIDAGQKIKKTFSIEIDRSCAENSIITIPFDIEIESSGVVYWTDHSELVIDLKALDIKERLDRLPAEFSLKQNYPNPFNPRTIINYELPITNYVDLGIYNLLGQKLVTLISEKQNAGSHQVEWDASGFASGIYYYRIEAGEFVDVKKMILLR